MKKITYITLLLFASKLWGQSPRIEPQVINVAGDHRQVGTTGIYITDNIGEPFTETIGPNSGAMITQGFIQPEVISTVGFSLEVKGKNLTCFKKNDGEIRLQLTIPPQVTTVSVNYLWSSNVVCANNNCKDLIDLKADTFRVKVVITYSNAVGALKTDTVRSGKITILDEGLPCNVKVFSGITANGDGDNDGFTIENIEEFPNNKITIFNRWGKQIADIKGYNNITNSWPTKDKLDNLMATTYFYIIDLGDGSKPMKGWVELIKN